MIYFFEPIGRIVRSSNISASEAPFNVLEGEAWLESAEVVSNDTHYVAYVGISETPTLTAFPTKPGDYYDFDFTTFTWVVSSTRLAAVRQLRETDLYAEFTTRRCTPILFNAHPFAATDEFLRDVTSILAAGNHLSAFPSGYTGLRSSDGGRTTVQASWADEVVYLQQILENCEVQRALCLIAFYAHQDGLAACTTVEALLAYDITSGWPV